jgi:flagellar biosynthesis protein FlhG
MTALMDQATQLRSLMARRASATVIAITSGKGGVGKSNIAVNLAIQLTSAGRDVVLLDADLGLANADVLCNIDLPCNLSHVIGRKRELGEVLVAAPGGFRLIGGASGLARMADLDDADRQRLIDALGQLERQTDVILIDTGAGISPNVLSFTRAADHVLIVTTPEPTAITDAYAVVKVVSRPTDRTRNGNDNGHVGGQSGNDDGNRTNPADVPGGTRLSLLVNQARSPGEAQLVYERIAKVARQFLGVGLLDAGSIPADEHVPLAVRRRVPFVVGSPQCPASRGVAQLAMRLEQGVSAQMQSGGFFNRMSRWFRR